MTDAAAGWPSDAEFRAAGGVDEWRVLPQGVYAYWRTSSFAEAVAFTTGIGTAAVDLGVEPDVDVRGEGVTVRLGSYETGQLSAQDTALARAISETARAMSLEADPSRLLIVQIAIAQGADADTQAFWRALTGYAPRGDEDASDPRRRWPNLWFHPLRGGAPGRGRLHLDLVYPTDVAAERITAALAAGGRIVDESHAPIWITLASPDNHGVDVPGPPPTGAADGGRT